MSTTIDEKVVEMKFDNSDFESGVSKSLSSLSNLKSSLNFSGAASSFESLGSAASSVGSNVDTVNVKFSALQVVAVTALQNITNAALELGENLLSALTIDSIVAGFSEYETQIGAIQTIMANTASDGTTLDEVNAALDELNKYADLTIYNFTEMTKNIGTFTAAGIDLDTSVSAIQGIANLAAVSGSTSQQASTAMYQLSQALAAGTLKLQDWNSVVNAGMGGETFQNALKETARTYGIAVDDIIEASGSFRESLSEGWVTAEILTETLSKFTVSGVNEYLVEHTDYTLEDIEAMREQAIATGDSSTAYQEMAEKLAESSDLTSDQIYELLNMSTTAEDAATKVKTFSQLIDTLAEAMQSGWTESWEIIIGDFEEAKALFTELSDFFSSMIEESAEARNAMLTASMESSWEQIEDAIEAAGMEVEDFEGKLALVCARSGVDIETLVGEYDSLEDAIQAGVVSTEDIIDALVELGLVTQSVDDSTISYVKYTAVSANEVLTDMADEADTTAQSIYELNEEILSNPNEIYAGQIIKVSEATDDYITLTAEQAESLQELAVDINTADEELNNLVQTTEKQGGRQLLIESLMTSLEFLQDMIAAISTAWSKAFSLDASDIYSIIEAIHSFTENLKLSDETLEKITSTFNGLFAILDLIVDVITGVFRVAMELVGELIGDVDIDILSYTATLGDLIGAFRDWVEENDAIVKALEYLIDKLKEAISWVKDWITAFLQTEQVQSVINKLKTVFNDTFGDIDGWIETCIEEFNKFVDYVKNFGPITADNFTEILTAFANMVYNMIGGEETLNAATAFASEKLEQLYDTFIYLKNILATANWSALWSDVTSVFTDAGDQLSGFAKKVTDFVNNIVDAVGQFVNVGALLAIGGGVALIAFAASISKTLKSIISPLDSINELLESLQNKINAEAFKARAEAVQILASAILILAASLVVLSQIDSAKLGDAVVALGLLTALIAALYVFVNKLQSGAEGTKKAISSITSIISLSASILLLSIAFQKIANSNTNLSEAVSSLAILATIIAALGTVVVVINKFSGSTKKAIIGTVNILAFAASVLLVVNALQQITEMDLTHIGESLVTLLAIIGSLALVMVACKNVKATGTTALAAALSLYVLIGVINSLDKVDVDAILDNFEAYIAIFASFALLCAASSLAGTNSAKAGVGILAMSAAILVIVQAMKQIGDMDQADVNKATGCIEALMVCMSVMIACTSLAGKYSVRSGAMLLMVSGAIAILAIIIAALGLLDASDVAIGVAAIVALEAAFAVLLVAVSAASKVEKVSSTLIATIVVVGILGTLLGVLSLLDAGNVAAVAASISVAMLAFAASLAIINTTSKAVNTSYSTILAMILVAGALSLLLAALCGCDGIENAISVATSLSILLVALSAAVAIVSAISKVSSALTGLASLTLFITGVGAFIVALGALVTYVPGAQEFLDKGIPVLESIGTAIGSFLGSIISGFVESALSFLPTVSENIASFMENFEDVDSSVLDGVSTVVEAILLLSAASFVNGLTNIFSIFTGKSSFESLADQLDCLCDAVVTFSDGMSGVDLSTVEKGTEAGLAIMEMASAVPTEGGLWGILSGNGEGKIASIASQLGTLAQGIVDFVDTASTADFSNVDSICSAAEAIMEMASNVPNEGGLWGMLSGNGEGKISSFATQLGVLGNGLVDFVNATSGANFGNVDSICTAALAITEMASDIPNEGGLWGILSGNGEGKITAFAEQLAALGDGIVDFANSTSGANFGNVDSAADAALLVTEMASNIPNEGGLWGMLTGNSEGKMSSFASQIGEFGQGLANFAENTAGVSESSVSGPVEAAQAISEGLSGLEYKNNEKVTKFATQLTTFAQAMGEFADSAGNITTNSVIEPINAAVTIAGELEEIDYEKNKNITTFGTQLTEFGGYLATFQMNVEGVDFLTSFTNIASAIETFSSIDVDSANIDNASEAFTTIANMTKSIPTEGGLWGMIVGKTEGNISSFASQLGSLGSGLASFVANAGSDFSNVEEATSAAKLIAESTAAIPEEGGLWGIIMGKSEGSIEEFALQLASYAAGISSFSSNAADVNISSVTTAVTAGAMIATSTAVISDDTSTLLVDFSEAIVEFGQSLTTLSSLNDINVDDICTIFSSLGEASVTAYIESIQGEKPEVLNTTDDMMSAMVDTVDGYNGVLPGAYDTILDTSHSEILSRTSDFSNAGGELTESLSKGTTSTSSSLTQAASNNMSTTLEAIESYYSNFASAGEGLTGELADGVESDMNSIPNAFDTVLDDSVTSINKKESDFLTAGGNLVDGLVDGVEAEESTATSTISNLGSSLLQSLKNVLGINSPSKETKEIGEYIDTGLESGIEKKANVPVTAIEEVGDETIEAFRDVVGVHSNSWIFEEIGEYCMSGLESGLLDGSSSVIDVLEDLGIEMDEWVLEIFSEYETVSDLTSAMETLTDSTDEVTESTEEATEATSDYSSSVSSTTEEVVDASETMDKVIEDFNTRFSDTLSLMDDTESADAARTAVDLLAQSVYEQALALEDSASSTEESTLTIDEAFLDMYDTITDAVEGSIDIFSTFSKSSEMSAAQLINNMKSQVLGVQEWADDIQKLAQKGVSQSLLQYLAEMGTAGYEYVNAFLEMTEEQLAEAEYYYAESLTLSDSTTTQIVSSFAYAALAASEEFEDALTSQDVTDEFVESTGEAIDAIENLADAALDTADATGEYVDATEESIEATDLLTESTLDGVEAETLSTEETNLNTESILENTEAVLENSELAVDVLENTELQTEATGELTEATAEMTDATGELTEATAESIEITQEAIEATSDYASMYSTIYDAVDGSIDIFSEFDSEVELSSQDLLNNMQSQVDGIRSWADNMETLAQRGVSEGLLQELAELGPSGDGYEYVQAFVDMSDDQLSQANELYSTSLIIADEVASQVASSFSKAGLMASTGFEEAIDTTAGSAQAEAMGENAATALETVLEEHSPSRRTARAAENFGQGFIDGLGEISGSISTEVTTLGATIVTDFEEALNTNSAGFDGTVFVTTILTTITTTFDANQSMMTEIGVSIIQVISDGAASNVSVITTTFTTLITEIITILTESYSEFTEFGTTAVENIAKGFTSETTTATTAITTLVTKCVTAITNKKASFKTAGSTVMASCISGISSKQSSAVSKVQTIMSLCVTAITNKKNSFYTAGSTVMTSAVSGISSQQGSAVSKTTTIMSLCVSAISNKQNSFYNAASTTMAGAVSGISSQQGSAVSKVQTIMSACSSAINSCYSSFYSAGAYAGQGLVDGLNSKASAVYSAAYSLATAASRATAAALQENSPSKVTYEQGEYFGEGLLLGIESMTEAVSSEAEDLATSATEALNASVEQIQDAIDMNIDSQPSIVPVLDLSQIEEGASEINALLSGMQAMSVASFISAQAAEIQNGISDESEKASGSTFNFTQNNYSPKSLSRAEIYRQTKNQFSAMQRRVASS